MKTYCLINELKPEYVDDYVRVHEQAHLTGWRSQLNALKKAGAESCVAYIYKNWSILLYTCEDIGESFRALGEDDDNNRWQEMVAPFFAATPKFDGTGPIEPVRKIFDLNQQLEGTLEQP